MAVDFNQLADALMEQAQQLRHCAQLELDSVRHELISAQEAQRQAGVEIAALRHQVEIGRAHV